MRTLAFRCLRIAWAQWRYWWQDREPTWIPIQSDCPCRKPYVPYAIVSAPLPLQCLPLTRNPNVPSCPHASGRYDSPFRIYPFSYWKQEFRLLNDLNKSAHKSTSGSVNRTRFWKPNPQAAQRAILHEQSSHHVPDVCLESARYPRVKAKMQRLHLAKAGHLFPCRRLPLIQAPFPDGWSLFGWLASNLQEKKHLLRTSNVPEWMFPIRPKIPLSWTWQAKLLPYTQEEYPSSWERHLPKR